MNRKIKYVSIFIIVFLFTIRGNSTEQYPDKIYLHGELHYLLYYYPLEEYFELHPDKRPELYLWSTGLDRGYVATFEVLDDSLHVIDIEVQIPDTLDPNGNATYWQSVIEEVFPKLTDRNLTWVNQILELPPIEDLGAFPGLVSTNHRYILLEMERGVLRNELSLEVNEFDAYKGKLFDAFKGTSEYAITKADKLLSFSESEVDQVIRFEIIYIAKNLVEK